MAKKRFPTWLLLIVLFPGLVLALVGGMWAWAAMTAEKLHPDPQSIPSVTGPATAPRWSDAAEQARQIIRTGIAEQNVTGLSVAVGVGGEIVWAEGFGWADFETRVRVSPDTRFRIGTASKILTSAAAGLLLERDALKLDERIQTYVPEFTEKQWPVTLRHLMSHTGGVRNDAGDEGPLGEHCEAPIEGLTKLDGFGTRDLLFEPGTAMRYSNYGWVLVSAAIEKVTGQPLNTFMAREIFDPLAMDETKPDESRMQETTPEPVPGQATTYFPRFAADPRYGLQLMRPIDLSCYAGAMAYLSTPSDLARFVMAVKSGKLLKPETVQLLQTSANTSSGEATGYGLGWDLETVAINGEQVPVVGYDGEMMGGITNTILTFPRRDLVVIVTSNYPYADTPGLAVKIAEVFSRVTSSPGNR